MANISDSKRTQPSPADRSFPKTTRLAAVARRERTNGCECASGSAQPEGPRLSTPEEEAEELRSLRAFARRTGLTLPPWGGWENYVDDGLNDPDSDYQSDHGRWFL